MSLRMPPGMRRADAGTRIRRTPLLFDATAYSGCVQWLRADDLLTTADPTRITEVLAWTDRSGSGNDATAVVSGGSRHPMFERAAHAGRAAISFNGYPLTSALTPVTGAAARTILCVCGYTQLRPQAGLYGFGSNSANTGFTFHINSNIYRLRYGNTEGAASVITPATTGVDVLIGTYDGTTARLYINGPEAASGTVTLNTPAGSAGRVGSNLAGTDQYFGLLFEVAAYNRALSSAEVTEINALLPAQYATGR